MSHGVQAAAEAGEEGVGGELEGEPRDVERAEHDARRLLLEQDLHAPEELRVQRAGRRVERLADLGRHRQVAVLGDALAQRDDLAAVRRDVVREVGRDALLGAGDDARVLDVDGVRVDAVVLGVELDLVDRHAAPVVLRPREGVRLDVADDQLMLETALDVRLHPPDQDLRVTLATALRRQLVLGALRLRAHPHPAARRVVRRPGLLEVAFEDALPVGGLGEPGFVGGGADAGGELVVVLQVARVELLGPAFAFLWTLRVAFSNFSRCSTGLLARRRHMLVTDGAGALGLGADRSGSLSLTYSLTCRLAPAPWRRRAPWRRCGTSGRSRGRSFAGERRLRKLPPGAGPPAS
jgi:hypothetical protein